MTDISYHTIQLDYQDRIAILRLNRPDKANGLNVQMASELAHASRRLSQDSRVKALVLTGSGSFFCAGGDIKAMSGFGEDVAVGLKGIADDLHQAISNLSRMPAPLIVAVNGTAAGAGMSLAAIGDLVLASEKAKFTMAYSKIGLSPDGSSSYFLPRLIGLRKTQELMFTNRVLSAEEAVDWGLINRVVAHDELLDEANKFAQQFAAGSLNSNAAIKALLLHSYSNQLEAQMELESRSIAACSAAADGVEGVSAFLDKRSPEFD